MVRTQLTLEYAWRVFRIVYAIHVDHRNVYIYCRGDENRVTQYIKWKRKGTKGHTRIHTPK